MFILNWWQRSGRLFNQVWVEELNFLTDYNFDFFFEKLINILMWRWTLILRRFRWLEALEACEVLGLRLSREASFRSSSPPSASRSRVVWILAPPISSPDPFLELLNLDQISHVEQFNVADQVIHDHYQIVDNEGAYHSNHDIANGQVLIYIFDKATEANDHAEKKVEANLVDQMLLVDQTILPFTLKYNEYHHEKAC